MKQYLIYLCFFSFPAYSAVDLYRSNIPVIPASNKIPAAVIVAQMNEYFSLKTVNPALARQLLLQILKENPQNTMANTEMGYLLMNDKDDAAAKVYFVKALLLEPTNKTLENQINAINEKPQPKQLATETIKPNPPNPLDTYYQLKKNNPAKAILLLNTLVKEKTTDPFLNAEMGYHLLNEKKPELALEYFNRALKYNPKNPVILEQITVTKRSLKPKGQPTKPLSEKEALVNQYYALKKTNPAAAFLILKKLVHQYPKDLTIQREMAYFLLKDKKTVLALQQFYRVEYLAPKDYSIKMQIGYLLTELDKNREAYSYFAKVTKTMDAALKLKANKALTNLSGLQTKILHKPWFADTYLAPLYYSRFGMMIYPAQSRIGRTFGKKQQLETYFINRTAWDSKSGRVLSNFTLPQIYDDNVAIFALGSRWRPFYNKVPGLQFYAEAGKAYNIIPGENNTNPNQRWVNDYRGGILFWAGWGLTHDYVPQLAFPFKFFGSFYNDITYFSRYNNNIIGYGSFREGLRIAQYGVSELNFYFRARGGFDTNRQFYNNFVEVGPGIEFVPNNRYSFSIRVEALKGYYIKVNSPSVNPYGPNYNDCFATAELYMIF